MLRSFCTRLLGGIIYHIHYSASNLHTELSIEIGQNIINIQYLGEKDPKYVVEKQAGQQQRRDLKWESILMITAAVQLIIPLTLDPKKSNLSLFYLP